MKRKPKASPQKAPRRARGSVRFDVWLDPAHAALLTALSEKHKGNATETVKEALGMLFVSRPRQAQTAVTILSEVAKEIQTGVPSVYRCALRRCETCGELDGQHDRVAP